MPTLEDLLPSQPKLSEDYSPSSVHCKFITGAAGTGKTHKQREAIKDNPNYGILCATTGIAAINLGTTTLNSVLRFFDTESLRDRFNRGTLTSTLHKLGKTQKRLVIDEVSMMDAKQLDYIYQAMLQVNEYKDMQDEPIGMVLTGDFCQLPPVKSDFVFKADCWEHFERNTETLTKIWRQDNPNFLSALNFARSGKGTKCVEILEEIGVRFIPQTINDFQGTTIRPKNQQVDNFNFSRLLGIPGTIYTLKSFKWGDQAGEWKNIPDELKLKDGAYVMILANDTSGTFEYANGDCGYVQQRDLDGTIWVKLVRNQKSVPIPPIIRYKTTSHEDGRKMGLRENDPGAELRNRPRMEHLWCEKDCGWDLPGRRHGTWGFPSYNCSSGTFNVGAIKFYPLRLAYATSVHKSQGLTLDKCQIDVRDPFFGESGMAYVSLSRCRTPEGLTIVGTPEKLSDRIKVNPKVLRWI
jgi:hypothetical protein